MANRMSECSGNHTLLGTYLKDRRTKLDPAGFGFPLKRRRTPGLRREEVAQRANISPTWYTWLEQGRGGAPSADVLDRIARALMLTDVEREHLFLVGLGRPPEVREKNEGVTPRLQRVLDALAGQRGSGTHGEAVKQIRHPVLGPLAFEYSAFAVDGRPDLSMVVYNPATPEDAERIKSVFA
jgi:transcriptional regulator with XRE-family HTH domain